MAPGMRGLRLWAEAFFHTGGKTILQADTPVTPDQLVSQKDKPGLIQLSAVGFRVLAYNIAQKRVAQLPQPLAADKRVFRFTLCQIVQQRCPVDSLAVKCQAGSEQRSESSSAQAVTA